MHLNLKKPFLACLIGIMPFSGAFSQTTTLTAKVNETGVPWEQQQYFHYAKDVDIKSLLESFGAIQGINVVIDPAITGKVNGKFEGISPDQFLKQISDAHNLIWYYDGNILHFYPGSKIESRILSVSNLDSQKLLATLKSLNVTSPQSSVRVFDEGGVVFVSGPPGYIDLLEKLGSHIQQRMEVTYWRQPTIKIFPLKYAWAYDVSFESGSNTITIPGVARMLRGLMETGMDVGPNVVSGDEINPTDADNTGHKMNKLMGKGLIKSNLAKDIQAGEVALGEAATGDYPDKDKNNGIGLISPSIIQADTHNNSIIIRDIPEKMSQYQAIIDTLDTPVKIIEISAMIVDVNSDDSIGLGNQYFKLDFGKKSQDSIAVAPNGDTPTPASSGFNFDIDMRSVVNSVKFTTQIQALQRNGRAKVLARPTVLTLNNLAATITKQQTFYVKLQGDRQVDLVNVSAGTTLNVTPRYIEDKGKKKIKLMVSIQDGSADVSSNITGNPIVSNDTINTQAVIMEQQSLLVGGYYRHSEGINEGGVPILKEIPLLGFLFKTRTKTKTIMERMFLITPRVVDIDNEGNIDVQKQFDYPLKPIGEGPYPPADEQKRRDDQKFDSRMEVREALQTAGLPVWSKKTNKKKPEPTVETDAVEPQPVVEASEAEPVARKSRYIKRNGPKS